MEFFKEHFTKHYFKHAPHKWFFAVLISPIHHAEMRYKHLYHLKFAHAKKLFAFDMILLLSTIVLFAMATFWWLYDPTITELVHLDVTVSTETNRLRSGDDITLSISYSNDSDVSLIDPILHIKLPIGFVTEEMNKEQSFYNGGNIMKIPLDNVPPDNSGELLLKGKYYGPKDEDQSIETMLIYKQEGKSAPESDIHRLFLTARETSSIISLEMQEYIIPGVLTPVTLTITNKQNHSLPPIQITPDMGYAYLKNGLPTVGIFTPESGTWKIESLSPNSSAKLEGYIHVPTNTKDDTLPWRLASSIELNNTNILEYTKIFDLPIAQPDVRTTDTWSKSFVQFGDKITLTVNAKNTGNVSLENPYIVYMGKTYLFNTSNLAKDETISLALPLSAEADGIKNLQNGEPIFIPKIDFYASIPGVTGYTYTSPIDITPLPIGTTISLNQSSRYYTTEGDQLGRGPLPPQVGKETKYWIFTQIQNTVGELTDVKFSTTLAPEAIWTGKSSVSKGNNLIYIPDKKTLTWSSNSLQPYESVGIYFEIAITPTEKDRKTIPQLITKSSVSGEDLYVKKTISADFGAMRASLSEDAIGKEKGVIVQ